jgi:aldehyde dehydrogenase (NAD+)
MSQGSPAADIERVFHLQQENRARLAGTTSAQRIAKLDHLQEAIDQRSFELSEAVRADLRKPPTEVLMTEVFPVTTEIRHACRNLQQWLQPIPLPTPLVFFGARSEVRYQPKGASLILSPWNFPFQLAVGPVVSAVAAGSTVILKPSEISPHTSRFVEKLLSAVFPEEEVAVFQGDAVVAERLLGLPFDHVFFTGSPEVGKKVMAAAAQHLASVTLELGGKCPALLTPSADVKQAARKIAWGKFVNAGQSCLAPDYVLLPQAAVSTFVEWTRSFVAKRYGTLESAEASPDYGCIISERHWERLKRLVDSACAAGARLEMGGRFSEGRFVSPTVLTNVPLDAPVMQEEIFGPVLPVLGYQSLDEALAVVNQRPNPLALYIFSTDDDSIERILAGTRAGGSLVNDVVVHFANLALPFGGAGFSGIGRAHGYAGFQAFSHERSVMRQPRRTLLELFYPPYGKLSEGLARLVARFL